jgi:hypothetical protein
MDLIHLICRIKKKKKLIEHYQNKLGAYNLGGHRMIIPTEAA